METILIERVTRKHGVPSVQEYLVWWKSLLRQKASWEREDALGKFANWIRQFESEVSIGSSMAWVWESVTPSFSWTNPHMGRIPPCVQMSLLRPYVRGGNVLETCGGFFD